ncbi:MAG: Universal stress protein family protein [bacterium]|nr:Universal stress protein family protein [bacterium]
MKRILVCLDGSPAQVAVLDTAATVAGALGAKLILFHAVAIPVHLPQQALALPPTDVGGLLSDMARTQLEELAAARPQLVERVQVEIGTAWRAVCETAKADAVDLVVIGSHSYGGLDRLLGTTAAKIVDHAPCSVYVVRTDD